MSGIKKFFKRFTKSEPDLSSSPEWWRESIHWHVNHPATLRGHWNVAETRESGQQSNEAKARLSPEDYKKWSGAISVGIDWRRQRIKAAKARLTPEQFEKWLREEEQPLTLDVEELIEVFEGKVSPPPEMQEQRAREIRALGSEEEGERLSLQDRPRLDEEIVAWAAGIDRDELKQWIRLDLVDMSVEEILGDFDHMLSEYSPEWRMSIEWGADPIIDTPQTQGAEVVIGASGVVYEDYDDEIKLHRALGNDLYITQGKLRKMKELYGQLMVEMSLLEPVSEPEVSEKVEEAQVPDRGIEWVRATFLDKLQALDVDIGIDFFVIEEIGEGRILVKGKGYLDRPIWGALNDMVRRELGGRYDSSERGWVIEK